MAVLRVEVVEVFLMGITCQGISDGYYMSRYLL